MMPQNQEQIFARQLLIMQGILKLLLCARYQGMRVETGRYLNQDNSLQIYFSSPLVLISVNLK
jgi:hypothetical protein